MAEWLCKNRVQLAWNKWREITGVICDKKIPVKLKHKIYKTVIKPTMTYGAECWTMKKKDEMLMNKTEMRMLRWIQGVSLREHKRNEEIREAATVQPIATRPGVNPPSTIPNPIPVDFLIPNPIPVNLAMIPNPIPIPVIFPSAIPNPNPIPISSYWYEIIVREFRN